MKKNIFVIVALVLSMTASFAVPEKGEPIPLVIRPIKNIGGHNPLPKSPVQIPEVYLEDSVLYFDAAIEGCTVQLLDEDENVVFADSIEENQTTLTFPSTLTGEFELQIIQDDIIFYCIIELE